MVFSAMSSAKLYLGTLGNLYERNNLLIPRVTRCSNDQQTKIKLTVIPN